MFYLGDISFFAFDLKLRNAHASTRERCPAGDI